MHLAAILLLPAVQGYVRAPSGALLPRLGSIRVSPPIAVIDAPVVEHLGSTLAFADQAGNLAGVLFPASLPPYLLFLYFLNQDVNGLSPTAKAGFTSLLAFVIATVVTSIVAVKSFGLNLANVDWLHASAEQLLSFTNVADVVGLKLTLDAFAAGDGATPSPSGSSPALPVIGATALLSLGITWAAAGGGLGEHTAFLGGVGNLPEGLWTFGFPEPPNALSLPTWVIHLSSLFEWLVAMGLMWRIGTVSGNPRWKGMTWAMIPSHSSGVCACVYHFFYNAPSLQFVVLLQAALTLLGNCTLAFAAWRLAVSNGWTFSMPSLGGGEEANDSSDDGVSAKPAPPAAVSAAAAAVDGSGGGVGGLFTILAWSVVGSYVVKYGETLLPFVLDDDSLVVPVAASLMIAGVTSFNIFKWQQRSQAEEDFGGLI